MTIKIETMTREEVNQRGIAGSNPCDHTVIDLSEMKEGMHTLSVLLPNGDAATFCVIPFFSADGGKSGTIDFKYHTNEGSSKVIGFSTKGDQHVEAEVYTLAYKNKKA